MGVLDFDTINLALDRGANLAGEMESAGLITAAALFLGDERRIVGAAGIGALPTG